MAPCCGQSGDHFIAAGEGPKPAGSCSLQDGDFIKWWGGKGTDGAQFNVASQHRDSFERTRLTWPMLNNSTKFSPRMGKFLKSVDQLRYAGGLFVTSPT